jgi:ribose/xylose/arabinose/galactoside ABC-type transport system permease subunit
MKQQPEIIDKKKSTFFKGSNSVVLMILLGFIAAIVVGQLIQSTMAGNVKYPSMIAPSNITNVLGQVSATGMMAMGMAIVMIAGGIDLSVGRLTSFVVLFVAKSFSDWGFALPVSIIVAVGLAVLFETGLGFVISRLRVEPFIITLGGMISFQGAALLIVQSKEVNIGTALDPLKNTVISIKDNVGLSVNIPPYIFIFLIITVIIWWVLRYTKYGRRVYAVGANPQAAYLAGINVKNMTLSTYSLNGLMVGIAGVCLLARVNTAIITVGQDLEIDVIAAAVVGGVALSGGKGNAWGVFLGVLLMGFISNGMNILKLMSEWQFLVKGLVIIAAVSAGAIATTLQTRRQLKQQNAGDTKAQAHKDGAA